MIEKSDRRDTMIEKNTFHNRLDRIIAHDIYFSKNKKIYRSSYIGYSYIFDKINYPLFGIFQYRDQTKNKKKDKYVFKDI